MRKASGVRGIGAQDILVRNECPLEESAKKKRKNIRSVSFSKTSPVYSETNVCSPETWRWLVWLHPCEEKMGLLMLLLVVMAASSHLRGTTERSLVTIESIMWCVQWLLFQRGAYLDTKIKKYSNSILHSGLMLVKFIWLCGLRQKGCEIIWADKSCQKNKANLTESKSSSQIWFQQI